jgi:hypothetical protein
MLAAIFLGALTRAREHGFQQIEDIWMISGAVERTAPSIAPVPMIRHNAEQAQM